MCVCGGGYLCASEKLHCEGKATSKTNWMTLSLLQGGRWEASLSQENSQQERAHYNAVPCDPTTYWSPATLHPPASEPLSRGQVRFVENKRSDCLRVLTNCVVLLRFLKAKS